MGLTPPRRSVPANRGTAASTIPLHVVQQTVFHGPDHHLLFRMDSQFFLNAVDRVADGDGLVAPGLGDLGVGLAAGKQLQDLPLPVSQRFQGPTRGEPPLWPRIIAKTRLMDLSGMRRRPWDTSRIASARSSNPESFCR